MAEKANNKTKTGKPDIEDLLTKIANKGTPEGEKPLTRQERAAMNKRSSKQKGSKLTMKALAKEKAVIAKRKTKGKPKLAKVRKGQNKKIHIVI